MTDSRSESQWRRTLDYLETAMAGVSVTMEDCGWPIGVQVARRASEGLRPSTCLGRQVTYARYFPAGMDKQEMPSGTLIRDAEFEQLRHGELYLSVRLPVRCEAERGVCAVCYGADPESGALEPVGSPIGEMAVRALRFPRRASMRRELSFHLGEGVLRCPAPSSGTVRLAVPPDLQLERGKDQFLDSPFCRVVRDPDGSGPSCRCSLATPSSRSCSRRNRASSSMLATGSSRTDRCLSEAPVGTAVPRPAAASGPASRGEEASESGAAESHTGLRAVEQVRAWTPADPGRSRTTGQAREWSPALGG